MTHEPETDMLDPAFAAKIAAYAAAVDAFALAVSKPGFELKILHQ